VFSSRAMRAQLINVYLLALGVSDSVMLVSAFSSLCLQRFAEITGWWSFAYFRWVFFVQIYLYLYKKMLNVIYLLVIFLNFFQIYFYF
jgi:hypothetical protein